VRQAAVEGLSELGDLRGLALAAKLKTDPHPEVREAARDAEQQEREAREGARQED
jgi:HEAT repeat protein